MNRETAKKMAISKDCHCVEGKNRDNNYNEVIDLIFNVMENRIDSAYIIGVFNVSGINGTIKELNRLKELKMKPHDFIRI